MSDEREKETITADDVAQLRIVEAVGTSANTGGMHKNVLTQRLEDAQVKVIEDAIKDGISLSDTEELLKRKAAARKAIMDEVNGVKPEEAPAPAPEG